MPFKLLYIAGCLLVPVLWGVTVNWLFDLWQRRTTSRGDDEPLFPDYQI